MNGLSLAPGHYVLHARVEISTSNPPFSAADAASTLIPTSYAAACRLLDRSTTPPTSIDLTNLSVPAATLTGSTAFNTVITPTTMVATLDAVVNLAVGTTFAVQCGRANPLSEGGYFIDQGAGKMIAIQVAGPDATTATTATATAAAATAATISR